MNVLDAINHWPKVSASFATQVTTNTNGEVSTTWTTTGAANVWKWTENSTLVDQAGRLQITEIHKFCFDPTTVTADTSISTGEIVTLAFTTSTTITDSNSGFVSAGFFVGQKITIVTTSGVNDGTAIITAVAAGTLTCEASSFTVEIAAAVGAATLTNAFDITAPLQVTVDGVVYSIEGKDNVLSNDQVQTLIGRRDAA